MHKSSISSQEARQGIIASQYLSSTAHHSNALESSLSTIEQLGYIQIDTISVVERAHHHTLWARNPLYTPALLNELVARKHVFEYWSHAAAYLPMQDYRFTLPMKKAISSGAQKHWFKRDLALMQSVLDRIKQEGPLMAKDFANTKGKLSDWEAKPSKQALENLFIEGELMISSRLNFHKVYDLTERVLPSHINTKVPTVDESLRFLITSFLRANGLGQASEMVYLRKGIKKQVVSTLNVMLEAKELDLITVNQMDYYCLPHFVNSLKAKPNTLNILSPFDNLLIQRKRTKALFEFDYLLECYVPAQKRQYGYFSLPILWEENLIGRIDCKADRKTRLFHINLLALEPTFKITDEFLAALSKVIKQFMDFNNSVDYNIHKTTPINFKNVINAVLKEF